MPYAHKRISRRQLLLTGLALPLCGCAARSQMSREAASERLAEIQADTGGRIGVYALDTASNASIAFDENSRFAMASTFKFLLAAAVLARIDAGTLKPQNRVPFVVDDLLDYSPVAREQAERGAMTVSDLCAAAVEFSDNTAANLLLSLVDGPAGLTRFLRDIGDPSTRLDRIEPHLNSNLPDDPRDTTTPRAMVGSLQKLLLGSVLTQASRDQLTQWLVNSKTGAKRLRAGLPADWKVGDKTGTGSNGAVNDVAVAWPPGRKPILIAAYMSDSALPIASLEAAHAQIADCIARSFP